MWVLPKLLIISMSTVLWHPHGYFVAGGISFSLPSFCLSVSLVLGREACWKAEVLSFPLSSGNGIEKSLSLCFPQTSVRQQLQDLIFSANYSYASRKVQGQYCIWLLFVVSTSICAFILAMRNVYLHFVGSMCPEELTCWYHCNLSSPLSPAF